MARPAAFWTGLVVISTEYTLSPGHCLLLAEIKRIRPPIIWNGTRNDSPVLDRSSLDLALLLTSTPSNNLLTMQNRRALLWMNYYVKKNCTDGLRLNKTLAELHITWASTENEKTMIRLARPHKQVVGVGPQEHFLYSGGPRQCIIP
jgi:hypothetical protein